MYFDLTHKIPTHSKHTRSSSSNATRKPTELSFLAEHKPEREGQAGRLYFYASLL